MENVYLKKKPLNSSWFKTKCNKLKFPLFFISRSYGNYPIKEKAISKYRYVTYQSKGLCHADHTDKWL